MKLLVTSTLLLTAAIVMTGADAPSDVVYVSHEKVAASLANGGTLVTTPGFRVLGNHRNGLGGSEMHENDTHVFYVVDGTATIVIGGTLVESKTTAPGEIRGSSIQGGKEQVLSKGDVIVIPAGIPHWWKEAQAFSYFGVNVKKP
jgi:mannose-6-phosphate isomerase-like protein (cupin superfamily)